MPETQTKINPAPERKYHSVCPKCKGALTPVPSGSICLACADTLIFAPLEPVDERLSNRMRAHEAYPLATRIGLLLNKAARKQYDALVGKKDATVGSCWGPDVYAIDGLPGMYVRGHGGDKDGSGAVQARSDEHRLWVFWRWPEPKKLLDAVERVLDAQAAAVAESIANETSPECEGKEPYPLGAGEEASA